MAVRVGGCGTWVIYFNPRSGAKVPLALIIVHWNQQKLNTPCVHGILVPKFHSIVDNFQQRAKNFRILSSDRCYFLQSFLQQMILMFQMLNFQDPIILVDQNFAINRNLAQQFNSRSKICKEFGTKSFSFLFCLYVTRKYML